MQRSLRRIAIALSFALFCLQVPAPGRADAPIALVGGTLLDGYASRPVHDAAILIDGNRILAAGPRGALEIPDDAVVLDTRGQTMLPGLIDAHIHLDLIGHGNYARYYAFVAEHSSLTEVMRIAAGQMLAAGVTGGVDLGAPFSILEVRKEIDSGSIPGPRLTVSGPWITRRRYEGAGDFEQYLVRSTQEAVAATRELIEKGADIIKTWEGLTAEDYAAVVREAHKRGVKVHAHLYEPEAIRRALDAGVDVFHHVGSAGNPPYDDALVSEIAHKQIPIVQTISHRIWIYPATVAFPGRLDNPTLARGIPEPIYAELQRSFAHFERLPYFGQIALETRNARQSAGQFIEAGALLGVGTDAASPLNFHTEAMWREMSALVDAGMTPLEVISAATKTNAEILGRDDSVGTLEAGKLADILVVEGDPLFDINLLARVAFVVKDGVPWYTPAQASEALTRVGRAF